MLTGLARWWLDRAARRDAKRARRSVSGECVCGKVVTGKDLHVVMARSTDDAALGIEGGMTAMSADFCKAHCPGGCQRGCPSVAA